MTYDLLSKRIGIAAGTLASMGSRIGYSTSTTNIEKICIGLDITPGDLLEVIPDPPSKSKKKKKSKKKVNKKH